MEADIERDLSYYDHYSDPWRVGSCVAGGIRVTSWIYLHVSSSSGLKGYVEDGPAYGD